MGSRNRANLGVLNCLGTHLMGVPLCDLPRFTLLSVSGTFESSINLGINLGRSHRGTPLGWPNLHWHHGNSSFHATTNYWMMNKPDEVLALTELTGRRQVVSMIILSCSHGTRGLETPDLFIEV